MIQTAGFVRSWREIHKAYLFLAVTVGIATPLVAALVLCAPVNFNEHEGDLVTYYATKINGTFFGILVAGLASITLMMAVNTAFVASSELLERVAHRYGFHWLIVTNRRHSLYRIHLLNALFLFNDYRHYQRLPENPGRYVRDRPCCEFLYQYGIAFDLPLFYRHQGSNPVLHEPRRYAYSLDHSGKLLHFPGDRQASRYGPLGRHNGFCACRGRPMAKKRAPEIVHIGQADNEMEMILYLSESSSPDMHVIFRRPREESLGEPKDNEAYISFYTPRQGIPPKMAQKHFRFPLLRGSFYQRILFLLKIVEYELPDKNVCVHFGWPLSSWLDRLAIGVMVFNLMTLPRKFPQFNFEIGYFGCGISLKGK